LSRAKQVARLRHIFHKNKKELFFGKFKKLNKSNFISLIFIRLRYKFPKEKGEKFQEKSVFSKKSNLLSYQMSKNNSPNNGNATQKKKPQANALAPPMMHQPRMNSPTHSYSSFNSEGSKKRPISSPPERMSEYPKHYRSHDPEVEELVNNINQLGAGGSGRRNGSLDNLQAGRPKLGARYADDQSEYLAQMMESHRQLVADNHRIMEQLQNAERANRELSNARAHGDRSNSLQPEVPRPNNVMRDNVHHEEVLDEDGNQVQHINLILRPANYPEDVVSDIWREKIEKIINKLFRKANISMTGMAIESCRYGAMFINCGNVMKADQLTALVSVVNWASEGLPPMTCDPGIGLAMTPVLEMWIPAKGEAFERAMQVVEEFTEVGTASWRWIKTIDIAARKGMTFIFAADAFSASQIRDGGPIRFKYGFHAARAVIKQPNGYSGRGKQNKIYSISKRLTFYFLKEEISRQRTKMVTRLSLRLHFDWLKTCSDVARWATTICSIDLILSSSKRSHSVFLKSGSSKLLLLLTKTVFFCSKFPRTHSLKHKLNFLSNRHAFTLPTMNHNCAILFLNYKKINLNKNPRGAINNHIEFYLRFLKSNLKRFLIAHKGMASVKVLESKVLNSEEEKTNNHSKKDKHRTSSPSASAHDFVKKTSQIKSLERRKIFFDATNKALSINGQRIKKNGVIIKLLISYFFHCSTHQEHLSISNQLQSRWVVFENG
jgi:hypothetical protein